MSRFAQSAAWLVAVGVLTGVCRWSAADDLERYPPQPSAGAWPEPAQTQWPAASAAGPGNPPRVLPAAYQAPDAPASPGAVRPIPLSQPQSDHKPALGAFSGVNRRSLVNAGASLGIVLGLFLAVAWAVRRGMPRGSGLLPCEAVEVLGRAPLAGRQQVHLLRCGNKIVLVSVTAAGVETLTEISDPAEVDRLHSICQPPSAGGSLREWLGHFTGHGRPASYYPHTETEPVDFGHLESPSQHRA